MSCCCSSTAPHTSDAQTLPTPEVRDHAERAPVSEYTIAGMTCGHCVSAVTDEIGAIPGVHDVIVDLESGSLRFASDAPVSRTTVESAVKEAGYRLA